MSITLSLFAGLDYSQHAVQLHVLDCDGNVLFGRYPRNALMCSASHTIDATVQTK